MKVHVYFSFNIMMMLCLLNTILYAQEKMHKMILEDGTAVKVYPEGAIELMFSPDKQIKSAYITKDGKVTTTYTEANGSSGKEEKDKSLALPGANFSAVDLTQLDDSSRVSFMNARRNYFNYFTEAYKHRQKVFRWQLLSSKIIFIVVVMLVFSGVVFAAIQFYAGLRNINKERGDITTFEAGSTGLKVSSPVLGIIILVLSLAFFYLYLIYVYPIEEIF